MRAFVILFLAGLIAAQALQYSPVPTKLRVPIHTVYQVTEDDELWGISDLTGAVNSVGNFIGNTAQTAYTNTRNTVVQNYHTLEDNVHQTIASFTEFKGAIAAWQQVDYKTGRGVSNAIKITAKDCKGLYQALNKLSGGRLNGAALHYAEVVAVEVFPPAAVAIEAGKVVYRAYGQVKDITELLHNIDNDVKTHNWGALAVDGYKLFKIIAEDMK